MTETQPHQLDAPDFERQAPGTILQDFESLLELIGDRGLPVTPGQRFAGKTLETINERLTHPLELRLKRAVQKSYAPINGLYLLLRASGLAVIDAGAKKPVLRLDPVVLASWSTLNKAERYFALLKAWWAHAREDIIGEHDSWGGDASMRLINLLEWSPGVEDPTPEIPQDVEQLRYSLGFHHLALLELFGLVELRAMPPVEGKGWQPEWVRLSDWGTALLRSYVTRVSRVRISAAELETATFDLGDFFDPLARFERWSGQVRTQIPEWRRELEAPEMPFKPGRHLFKVSLGARCWRRIAIAGETDLDMLASAILSAFRFDPGHLYRFSYRDRFGRTVAIDHPDLVGESDNALADEVRIGDLPLSEGMQIGFLFDFGDCWEFDLVLERVSSEPASPKPQVLEAHGEAPSQYGDDEDW